MSSYRLTIAAYNLGSRYWARSGKSLGTFEKRIKSIKKIDFIL